MTGTFREAAAAMDDGALELSLVNDLRELAGVAARIDAFCADRSLGPQVGYAVNLAVDEVLTNTINFGYDDDDPHRIEVVVWVEADAVVVVIVDDSNAFDPSRAPEADTGSTIEDRVLNGLGLFLVHQMMDGVEYRHQGGCNVVTLTKRTGGAGGGNVSSGA